MKVYLWKWNSFLKLNNITSLNLLPRIIPNFIKLAFQGLIVFGVYSSFEDPWRYFIFSNKEHYAFIVFRFEVCADVVQRTDFNNSLRLLLTLLLTHGWYGQQTSHCVVLITAILFLIAPVSVMHCSCQWRRCRPVQNCCWWTSGFPTIPEPHHESLHKQGSYSLLQRFRKIFMNLEIKIEVKKSVTYEETGCCSIFYWIFNFEIQSQIFIKIVWSFRASVVSLPIFRNYMTDIPKRSESTQREPKAQNKSLWTFWLYFGIEDKIGRTIITLPEVI